jgi:hypothetical protein
MIIRIPPKHLPIPSVSQPLPSTAWGCPRASFKMYLRCLIGLISSNPLPCRPCQPLTWTWFCMCARPLTPSRCLASIPAPWSSRCCCPSYSSCPLTWPHALSSRSGMHVHPQEHVVTHRFDAQTRLRPLYAPMLKHTLRTHQCKFLHTLDVISLPWAAWD